MKRVFVLVPILASCSLISLDDLRSGDAGGDVAREASCGDTTSSASNCGACGHDCLGGECKASACQPVALASIQVIPSSVAVENAWVYWISNSSEIRRTPTSVDAGTVSRVGSTGVAGLQTIAPVSPTIHGLAANGQFLAVTVAENEPATGNAPATVPYLNVTYALWLAWDSGHHYLYAQSSDCTGSSGYCILAYDDPSAAPKRFADNLAKFGLLTVDGGRVFYASGTTVGTFVYTDAIGSGTTIATTTDVPGAIAADGNGVYLTSYSFGSILMVPRAGTPDGGAPAVIASGQINPGFLVAHAGLIAWSGADGLWSCDPTACNAKLVVPQAHVSSIAIDSAAIYWSDTSRAGIYKVAR